MCVCVGNRLKIRYNSGENAEERICMLLLVERTIWALVRNVFRSAYTHALSNVIQFDVIFIFFGKIEAYKLYVSA